MDGILSRESAGGPDPSRTPLLFHAGNDVTGGGSPRTSEPETAADVRRRRLHLLHQHHHLHDYHDEFRDAGAAHTIAAPDGFTVSDRHSVRPPDGSDGGDGEAPDWRRFVALGQFCLMSASVAMQWIVFANAVGPTRRLFDISVTQVDLLSMCFFFTVVPTLPLGSAVFDAYGLKPGTAAGSIINWLGSVIRLAVALWYPSYPLLLTASVVVAISQIFILEAPPLLSTIWFRPAERTLATTVAASSNSVGIAVGMIMTPLVIDAFPGESSSTALLVVLGVLAAVCTIDVALAVFVVPRSPREPPSAAAAQRIAETSGGTDGGARSLGESLHNFATDCAGVLRDRDGALCIAGMGTMLGGLWALSALLSQLLAPFGVGPTMAGWLGFGNIIFGTIAAVPISRRVDNRRQYKTPLLMLIGTGAVLYALLLGILVLRLPQGLLLGVYAVMGIAQFGAVPVAFELVAELTFPVNEAIGSGLMCHVAFTVALALNLGLGTAIGSEPTEGSCLVCFSVFGVLSLVALAAVAFVREHLRRKNHEDMADESASTSNSEAPDARLAPAE